MLWNFFAAYLPKVVSSSALPPCYIIEERYFVRFDNSLRFGKKDAGMSNLKNGLL
jgi:hypothetical protein